MLGGNDDNEEEPIDIEFTEKNALPEMMKMLLTLNHQMYKKKSRKILLWLTSLRITKANWWEKLSKKVTRWIFDDYGIVSNENKIKKMFFEVISNTKIFNIKFFQLSSQHPRFCQSYRRTGQRQIRYYTCFSNKTNAELSAH